MSFVADLHIHSRFSRATSPACALEGLHRWAQLKGVRLVATGDCTHPIWFQELREKLVPAGPGLFALRPDLAKPINESVPAACRAPVEFAITGEISGIYKRAGKTRKVHSLVFLPDFESTAAFNARMGKLGNIKSDGRPILGMDPRDLLTLLLETSPDAFLVPAHIWTPWFSMLGSKSGFDSPQECFGELSKHVFAVETGLSSDPPMNWRVSSLDSMALISNSDLHSPANLGRNANVFHGEPDFFAIRDGLRARDPARCGGTIDMFPEEGKYHADGHRKCGVCLEPEQSIKQGNRCHVCGQPLVLGVLHRVVELADRPAGFKPAAALPCEHIIPLPEILGELLECGPGSGKVGAAYNRLLARHGPELRVLRETDTTQLEPETPILLAEAIRRVRSEQVIRRPGYDGEYGEILVFAPGEKDKLLQQGVFVGMPQSAPARRKIRAKDVNEPRGHFGEHSMLVAESAAAGNVCSVEATAGCPVGSNLEWLGKLTTAQANAVQAGPEALMIVAGPGTGKTRTLTARLAWLIKKKQADPRSVLAITFTNRAARELCRRLALLLQGKRDFTEPLAFTFHGFALYLLRRFAAQAGHVADFRLISQEEEASLFQSSAGLSAREASKIMAETAKRRMRLESVEDLPGMAAHNAALQKGNWLPLEELVPAAVRLLRERSDFCAMIGFDWIGVDEFQDINHAQYELIRLLAPKGRGLTVIGDPDQAIYGFRGADVRYFQQFKNDFQNVRIVFLDTNFRSSATIVEASGQVVASARSPLSVEAKSDSGKGVQIRIHEAPTPAAEAEFIAHEIEQWLGGTAQFSMDSGRVDCASGAEGAGLGDIAVLARVRANIQPLAEAILRLGLPAQVVGALPLIEQPGGRKLLAMLQARVEMAPNEPVQQFIERDLRAADLRENECALLDECRALVANSKQSLRDFFDNLLLRQAADVYDERAEKIAVLTMHAAKGLEFPIVFIAGCEDGIVPYTRNEEETDLREERRLFYVAMTRAQRVLYLTRSRKRMIFGRSKAQAESPFVADIHKALTRQIKTAPLSKKIENKQMEFKLF